MILASITMMISPFEFKRTSKSTHHILYSTLRHPLRNLITWKDRDISLITCYLLLAALLICCLLPTRLIFALLVAFSFKIGSVMGLRKRQQRRAFLRELQQLASGHVEKEVDRAMRCHALVEACI